MAKSLKVTVRVVGYARWLVEAMGNLLFNGSTSGAVAYCIGYCREYEDEVTEKGMILDQVWFEAPRQKLKKKELEMTLLRIRDKRELSVYLGIEDTDYIDKMSDKERYPQFRGSKTNVIQACVYATSLLIMENRNADVRVVNMQTTDIVTGREDVLKLRIAELARTSVTYDELVGVLGVHRNTVTKTLHEMQREGTIIKNVSEIYVAGRKGRTTSYVLAR